MKHLMYQDAVQFLLVAKESAIEHHTAGGEKTRRMHGCAVRAAGIQLAPENGQIREEVHQDGLAGERRKILIPSARYFCGEAKKSARST